MVKRPSMAAAALVAAEEQHTEKHSVTSQAPAAVDDDAPPALPPGGPPPLPALGLGAIAKGIRRTTTDSAHPGEPFATPRDVRWSDPSVPVPDMRSAWSELDEHGFADPIDEEDAGAAATAGGAMVDVPLSGGGGGRAKGGGILGGGAKASAAAAAALSAVKAPAARRETTRSTHANGFFLEVEKPEQTSIIGVQCDPNPSGTGGVQVTQLRKDALGAKSGLRIGDVLLSVNGELLTTPEQAGSLLARRGGLGHARGRPGGEEVQVRVRPPQVIADREVGSRRLYWAVG